MASSPGSVSLWSPGSLYAPSSPALSILSPGRLSLGVSLQQTPKRISLKMRYGDDLATAKAQEYADHSPEYYLQLLDNFDESKLTQRIYSDNTMTLLKWVKQLFIRWQTKAFTRLIPANPLVV